MNLIPASGIAGGLQLDGGPLLKLAMPSTNSRRFTVGLRASALRVSGEGKDLPLAAKVELAEISGSDTFVHLDTPVGPLVAQLTGVHYFDLGAVITLYFNPALVYVFDSDGMLLLSPARGGEH